MTGEQPEEPTPPYPTTPPPTWGQQQAPQYGQQPTYGQYGQQPPSYGQYGQQPPAYGAPAPGYPAYPGYATAPPNDGMAVASMVVGIVSIVLSCGYGLGLLGSPVALVLGRISMKKIDRSNGTLGGRGFALAGFVLGIIGTVLLVLAIIAVVVIVVVAVNGGFDDSGSTYDSDYGLARLGG